MGCLKLTKFLRPTGLVMLSLKHEIDKISQTNWTRDVVPEAYSTDKQVDILISKNQALQILYLNHYVYKAT